MLKPGPNLGIWDLLSGPSVTARKAHGFQLRDIPPLQWPTSETHEQPVQSRLPDSAKWGPQCLPALPLGRPDSVIPQDSDPLGSLTSVCLGGPHPLLIGVKVSYSLSYVGVTPGGAKRLQCLLLSLLSS